jgi:hypothetical protein
MGTTPTSTDLTANFVNGLVGAFISGDVTVVEAYIGAQVPVLEAPVVSLFTNEIITLIANAIKKNVSEIATAIVIDIQTNGEESAVNETFKNYQAAKLTGNQDEITAAQQAFINAAASLAHSDGSATNVSS